MSAAVRRLSSFLVKLCVDSTASTFDFDSLSLRFVVESLLSNVLWEGQTMSLSSRKILFGSVFSSGVALLSALASAGPISVDGTIGVEWAGSTVKSVLYNASAALGNFGTPSNENHQVAYDIYTRGDGSYVYVGIQSIGSTGGLDFANLYFDTNPGTGSDIGFEVTSQRAFIPGGSGYYPYTTVGQDIHHAMTTGASSVIEFAVPYNFFSSDPLSMAFPTASSQVQLRLSQSFGYSVAGGSAGYGADRLGNVSLTVVPLPVAAWMGMALLGSVGGVGALRKRRAAAGR